MEAHTQILTRKLFDVLRPLGVDLKLTPKLSAIDGSCMYDITNADIYASRITGLPILVGGKKLVGSLGAYIGFEGSKRRVSYSRPGDHVDALGALLHAMDGADMNEDKFLSVVELSNSFLMQNKGKINTIALGIIHGLEERLAAAEKTAEQLRKNVTVEEKDGVIMLSSGIVEVAKTS